MNGKKKIKIAQRTFSSLTEFEAFTKATLLVLEHFQPITKPNDFGFYYLMELIDRHPDKQKKFKKPIKFFEIGQSIKKDGVTLKVHHAEGSSSISWRKCCHQRKETTHAKQNQAFRAAIAPQIVEKKNELMDVEYPVCELCRCNLGNDSKAELDHKTLNFTDIKKMFCEKFSDSIPKEFDSVGGVLGHLFKDEDFLIKSLWQQFHKEKADYQLLCFDCHRQKTARSVFTNQ